MKNSRRNQARLLRGECITSNKITCLPRRNVADLELIDDSINLKLGVGKLTTLKSVLTLLR
jgi:hypothetical protein